MNTINDLLWTMNLWSHNEPTTHEGILQRISDVCAGLNTLRSALRQAADAIVDCNHELQSLQERVGEVDSQILDLLSRDVIPWERAFMLAANWQAMRKEKSALLRRLEASKALQGRLEAALERMWTWPSLL